MQRVKWGENWLAYDTKLVHRPRIKFDSLQTDPIENVQLNYIATTGAKLKIDWGNGIVDDMICDGTSRSVYSAYVTVDTLYDIEIYGDIDSITQWWIISNTTLLNIEELQWCVNMSNFRTSNSTWPSYNGSIDKLAHLPLTNLYLWSSAGSGPGARGDGISGSLNHFSGLTIITSRSNPGIRANVDYWPEMLSLHLIDNTIGDFSSMPKLTTIASIRGAARVTGDITLLPDLWYINFANVYGVPNWTFPTTFIDMPQVSYIYTLTTSIYGPPFTSTQVNQYLADFWANRDEPKPFSSTRYLDFQGNTDTGAPTGQGITDATNLAAYKSPDDTGPVVWTVLTR